MATNIPTRRTTKATRTIDENAPRPVRGAISTRSKVSVLEVTSAAASKAPEKTALSRNAKEDATTAQGKRKRSALGEVTNNKGKATALAATKGKQLVSTKVTSRPPLAPKVQPEEEVEEEAEQGGGDAMLIDLPAAVPVRATRRMSTRSGTTVASAAPTRRGSAHKVATSRTGGRAKSRIQVAEDDDELTRAHKKRRSDTVEEEEVKAEVEEEPAVAQVEEELEGEAGWNDLDKEDEEDPIMVSEYVVDIFKYLREVEQTTMANPRYMDAQKELAWKMRGILVDWIIQVHQRFRLLPETLFLAVNIIDRFLSSRIVSLRKLQLVGVTCLFIASKFEEICAPSVKHFLHCADSSYTEAEILSAEKYVLKTIEWNLSYPNPIHFLRRASKADEYDIQVRTVAKYLVEISCVEWRLIGHAPSLIAAAGMWLSRLVLDRDEWSPNLVHYSGYSERQIIPTANIMLNYILKQDLDEEYNEKRHGNFFKKYCSRRFMKAAIFVHTWAHSQWEQNSAVDLEEELPRLRTLAADKRRHGVAGMEDEGETF